MSVEKRVRWHIVALYYTLAGGHYPADIKKCRYSSMFDGFNLRQCSRKHAVTIFDYGFCRQHAAKIDPDNETGWRND